MEKVKIYKDVRGVDYLLYVCKCDHEFHMIPVRTEDTGVKVWKFNFDLEKPTLSPSVLCRGGTSRQRNHTCHHFLHAGILEFCGDSTHPMAGQQIAIKDIEAELPGYWQ